MSTAEMKQVYGIKFCYLKHRIQELSSNTVATQMCLLGTYYGLL